MSREGQAWHGVQPPPADSPAPIGDRVRGRSILDPAPSRWDQEIPGGGYTRFNRDKLRGMMRSARLLEQLLERADREDLPALTWTVNQFAVSGERSFDGSGTPDQLREIFLAWIDALYIVDWRESTFNGEVQLRGATKVPAPGAPHLEVHVGLCVRWYVDEDAEPVNVPADTAG